MRVKDAAEATLSWWDSSKFLHQMQSIYLLKALLFFYFKPREKIKVGVEAHIQYICVKYMSWAIFLEENKWKWKSWHFIFVVTFLWMDKTFCWICIYVCRRRTPHWYNTEMCRNTFILNSNHHNPISVSWWRSDTQTYVYDPDTKEPWTTTNYLSIHDVSSSYVFLSTNIDTSFCRCWHASDQMIVEKCISSANVAFQFKYPANWHGVVSWKNTTRVYKINKTVDSNQGLTDTTENKKRQTVKSNHHRLKNLPAGVKISPKPFFFTAVF